MGAKRIGTAHRRVLDEGVVCVEMPFCIQEVASGCSCVRKRPPAHTGGIKRRERGAEEGAGAHEKVASDKTMSGMATDSRRA